MEPLVCEVTNIQPKRVRRPSEQKDLKFDVRILWWILKLSNFD